MSTTPYSGTLLLQKNQERLFLTVSIWWATLDPGDVLTGRIVSTSAQKAPIEISHHLQRSYHITKKGRLSPEREQREMELETLYIRDHEIVVLDIWRRDGTLLASTRYQIDAAHTRCLPYQDESERASPPHLEQITFMMKSHIIDQPYSGILLFDQRAAHYYEPGNTIVTLTIYLWWEALYRGDAVVIQPGHHGWSRSTKTALLDGGREQSMVEVETYAMEEDRESFHVFIRSGVGGTLAHTFFRVDTQARTVVDVYESQDMPRLLTFEVLNRGDAHTYTGKTRYRLCQHRGVPGDLDDLYEREEDALAACRAKGYSPDHLLQERQTRWHTWEQHTSAAK